MSDSGLTGLTLFVPSYRRPRFLQRQIAYWAGQGPRLLILEGSEVPLPIERGSLPENVEYHHLPQPFADRVAFAADRVDTPYACMLSDDEFFLPSALRQCLAALNGEPELVACAGRSLHFIARGQEWLCQVGDRLHQGYAILKTDPVERLLAHMNPYVPCCCYAVMKSSVWKRGMQLWAEGSRGSTCPYLGEVLFEMHTCFRGKVRVLPVLSWLRSLENAPVSHAQWNRKLDFADWLQDPRYAQEVENFYRVAGHYLQSGERSELPLDRVLRDALEAYLAFVRGLPSDPPAGRLSQAARWLPPPLRQSLRGLFRGLGLLAPEEWKSLAQARQVFEGQGVEVPEADLQRVLRSVQEFGVVRTGG